MKTVRLLVTRPEPDGRRTAERLRAQGCDVLLAPLLAVEDIPDADFGAAPLGGVAITSANAARAVAHHPRRAEIVSLPAFAVGQRTAEAARAAGFANVSSADGNKDDLVRLICAQCGGSAPLLYLCGADRAGDLTWELAAAGVSMRTVAVYRAKKAHEFPAPVRDALAAGALDGVLHFSRRTAEAYVDCAKVAGLIERALAPFHYCLSQNVAEPLIGAGACRLRIAPRPQEAALIGLVVTTGGK